MGEISNSHGQVQKQEHTQCLLKLELEFEKGGAIQSKSIPEFSWLDVQVLLMTLNKGLGELETKTATKCLTLNDTNQW